MKTGRKIFAWLLATISLFSVAACGKKDNGNYAEPIAPVVAEGKTHERSVATTAHKIVENGVSEYQILVKEEQKSEIALAITEFQTIFQSATGVKLPIVTDDSLSVSVDEAKYISLGDTALLEAANVEIDYETLGWQGYQIETAGKSLFVSGGARGVLYGAYDLLKILIDFEVYNSKVMYYQKGVRDLALPDVSVKEVPDIEYRIPVTGAETLDRATINRMYMVNKNEIIVPEGNAHNVLKYVVPIEEHVDEHGAWFSGDRTQLCYTAHGDAAEYAAMVDCAVGNIKEILLRNPSQKAFSITQMDVKTWCECDSCLAMKTFYGGANSATQIRFVNDVAEKIEIWLDEEQGGREVEFMFFAYHKSEQAPVKQNEDGTWSLIDDENIPGLEMKLRDNVSVWIALIYEDYTKSVTDPVAGVNVRQIMESWHEAADSYFIWAYTVYFDNYLIPYDSYGAFQDMIRYFVSHGTSFLWAQGNYNQHQNTGYDDLKGYLFSKLMWNCNLDMNELISDYFDKVYREAADIMEGTFWTWRAMCKQQELLGKSGNIYTSPKDKTYWPKRYLVGQLDAMEEAKKAIEVYKTTDPTLYQNIYDNIVCETITNRYLMMTLYSSTFSDADFAAFKAEFKADCNRLDFNMLSEFGTIDGILE